jgi:hypothetical protein
MNDRPVLDVPARDRRGCREAPARPALGCKEGANEVIESLQSGRRPADLQRGAQAVKELRDRALTRTVVSPDRWHLDCRGNQGLCLGGKICSCRGREPWRASEGPLSSQPRYSCVLCPQPKRQQSQSR